MRNSIEIAVQAACSPGRDLIKITRAPQCSQPAATSFARQGKALAAFWQPSSPPDIHSSISAGSVRITGIAFGWMGLTTEFASQVRKALADARVLH